MKDELISKQKILNTLKEWQGEDLPATLYGDGYEDAVSDIIRLIETEVPVMAVKPSVQPKTGRWAGTVCTACGESTSDYYNCDYCPRCGAKMKGEVK